MSNTRNRRRDVANDDERDGTTMITIAHPDGQGETTTVPLSAFREVWSKKGWYEAEPSASDADISEESVAAADDPK